MDHDTHARAIGKIVGNLQALELLIRLFLCGANGETIEFPTNTPSSMSQTYMTNYDSLGQLIDAYNGELVPTEASFSVDRTVVRIRDGFAHGRLMATSMSFPLTLYKFGKPNSGQVPIEFAETLSEGWLEASRLLIRQQMDKVRSCAKDRGYKSGP